MNETLRFAFGSMRHLQYFVTAAEAGSLRRAGEVLGLQESTVSRAVRDLEDRLGASLFIRHPSGVTLTLAGQCFLRRARQALVQIQQGLDEVAAIGCSQDGILRIGIFPTLASGFLGDLFRAYDTHHSNVHIEFVDAEANDHAAAIRNFDIDAAFVFGKFQWAQCDSLHLWTEEVFVALSEGHPLTRKEKVTWQDLVDEKFLVRSAGSGGEVREYLRRRLAVLGRRPLINAQRIGRSSLLGLVATGRGVAAATQSETVISVPGVVYRPIMGEALPISVIFSRRNDNPAFRALLSLARSMAQGSDRS
ncbi:LysR family transcriptional regulator [Xanthobacter sp. ZOL 2024]